LTGSAGTNPFSASQAAKVEATLRRWRTELLAGGLAVMTGSFDPVEERLSIQVGQAP
jgi:hypothetical protein